MPRRCGFHLWQPLEDSPQLGFHRRRVEVAAHGDNQFAAECAFVPRLQVVHRNRADSSQLRLPCVRAVGAVHQLGRLAAGNLVFLVVAPDNPRGHLLLRQFELFRAELRVKQQVHGERKHLVGVAFERVPRHRRGIHVSPGFNVRGLGFQQVIQRITAQLRSAAGAPRLPIKRHQPRFGRILVPLAARNQHRAVNKRQLVILLQK